MVDPRRTETADAAGEHVAIRPGTDALLLAGMLHVVFAEGLVRLGRFADHVSHLESLAALVHEFPPARVARRTGVGAETVRQLALDFADTTRAACYSRVGLCTQQHGTLASWLAQVLNLVTGHVDEEGTMMLTTPAVDVVGILARLGRHGTSRSRRSRVRNLPEFGGEPPVATLADEIEAKGAGQVRALITIAGNPVLSAPNGRRLDRALGSLEHMVSIDPYLNETTRHAHVVLPPVPPLSRSHYDLALNAFAVRNVASLRRAGYPPKPVGAARLGDPERARRACARPAELRGLAIRAARAMRPDRLLDLMLRAGPYRLSLARVARGPSRSRSRTASARSLHPARRHAGQEGRSCT